MLTEYQKSILNAAISGEENAEYTYEYEGDEMYSYSYTDNKNMNMKSNMNKNRFQHEVPVNLGAPEALSFPQSPSAPGAEAPEVSPRDTTLKRKAISGSGDEKPKIKKLSHNEHYVEIGIQISKFRQGTRHKRVNAYVSLKGENDKKFSVFLSGQGTNAKAEYIRGAKENQAILDIINDLKTLAPDGLITRLHYKAPRGHATDQTRKLLKSAILCIEELEGDFMAYLYLMGVIYEIPLNRELSERQAKSYYVASGLYQEMEDFEDDDEFE